jgi:uncharacterized protein (DUF488 family)
VSRRDHNTETAQTVYSIGYAGVKVDVFCAFVKAHDLRVVDIRHRPFSRNAAYNRKALTARLGVRYVHIPALGNRNYKGGPIALVDEAQGLERVRALLATGPIALLCVCASAQTCHRTVVTDRLALEGFRIVHARL